MLIRTALAATVSLCAAHVSMAQAACTGSLPLANPVTVAVGATVHVTPVDQNCNVIPNDAVTSKISGIVRFRG